MLAIQRQPLAQMIEHKHGRLMHQVHIHVLRTLRNMPYPAD
jgi:hypothetical protein